MGRRAGTCCRVPCSVSSPSRSCAAAVHRSSIEWQARVWRSSATDGPARVPAVENGMGLRPRYAARQSGSGRHARPFAFCRRAFCALRAGPNCEGTVRCGQKYCSATMLVFELHLTNTLWPMYLSTKRVTSRSGPSLASAPQRSSWVRKDKG